MYCNCEICSEIDHSEKYWPLVLSRFTNNGTKSTCFVFFQTNQKKKRWIGMYCTWDIIHCLADAETGMLRIQKIETPAKIIYPKYNKNSYESCTFVVFWQIGPIWVLLKSSAILLKYPISEGIFLHVFMGKINFRVPKHNHIVYSTWDK